MTDALPSLAGLQAFEATARRGSFAAAGRELALTASAVSHRLKALEEHLGHALFERGPHSLTLTDHGHAWLPVVHRTLDELQRGTEGVFGLGPRPARVTVRAPVSYVSEVLAPALPALRGDLGIDVLVVSSIWGPGGVEVAADLSVEFARDVHEPLGPVVTAALVRHPDPSGTTLRKVDVLGYEDLWADEALVGAAVRVASLADAQVDTWAAALQLVTRTPGWCALVPDLLVRDAVDRGRVVASGAHVPMRERFGLARRSPPRADPILVDRVAARLATLHG